MKRLIYFMFVQKFFLTTCGRKEIESNMSKEVNDFEFTTQVGESLPLEDLKGKWWVADFIFTKCTTVYLPMTSNTVKL